MKTRRRCAAVFLLSAKNRRGFKHPPPPSRAKVNLSATEPLDHQVDAGGGYLEYPFTLSRNASQAVQWRKQRGGGGVRGVS